MKDWSTDSPWVTLSIYRSTLLIYPIHPGSLYRFTDLPFPIYRSTPGHLFDLPFRSPTDLPRVTLSIYPRSTPPPIYLIIRIRAVWQSGVQIRTECMPNGPDTLFLGFLVGFGVIFGVGAGSVWQDLRFVGRIYRDFRSDPIPFLGMGYNEDGF